MMQTVVDAVRTGATPLTGASQDYNSLLDLNVNDGSNHRFRRRLSTAIEETYPTAL